MPVRRSSRSMASPPLDWSTPLRRVSGKSTVLTVTDHCSAWSGATNRTRWGSVGLARDLSETDLRGTLAQRAVDRSLGDRRTQYADEIQRVLEATYDLIERTGKVDPSLREILAATNLS